MKTKPPPDRRKFANAWDEVRYLYDKLLFWLYGRGNRRKSRLYAKRLEQLLPKVDPNNESVFGEECRSLLGEAKGDLCAAILHRENEIRLIRRLHELARNAAHPELVLSDYGYADLSDRLDLLATLYYESGNRDKAISTLQQSKKVCEAHGIEFDGEDLLREYVDERPDAMVSQRRPRKKRRTA